MCGIPSNLKNSPKSVYVVISRSKSVLSGAIMALTGDRYTHAALALDKELEFMYSFGRRRISNPFVGCFKRERLDDRFYTRHTRLPGVVFEIPVGQKQFQGVLDDIKVFLDDKDSYGFNVWGMITANFRKKETERGKKFFCSEFVYYVLRKNGLCDLGMPRSAVRPQHLLMIDYPAIFEGDLLRYPYQNPETVQAPLPMWT